MDTWADRSIMISLGLCQVIRCGWRSNAVGMMDDRESQLERPRFGVMGAVGGVEKGETGIVDRRESV